MYHAEFWHGTADDTVYHACELIVRNKLRFLPIMNPEEKLMLSVLSQIDILGRWIHRRHTYLILLFAYHLLLTPTFLTVSVRLPCQYVP